MRETKVQPLQPLYVLGASTTYAAPTSRYIVRLRERLHVHISNGQFPLWSTTANELHVLEVIAGIS